MAERPDDQTPKFRVFKRLWPAGKMPIFVTEEAWFPGTMSADKIGLNCDEMVEVLIRRNAMDTGM